jgi:hypothetical protein
LKPEKCFSKPQTPKNPLHALLGVFVVPDSLAEKDTAANMAKF